MKQTGLKALVWARGNVLEMCVLAMIVGTSTMIHAAMVRDGVPDGLYLWIAILAVDLLVVLSGAWGGVGLFVASIICTLNILIVLGVVPGLAPAMFSIAALLGTLGSYTQKQVHILMDKRTTQKAIGLTHSLVLDDKGMLKVAHYSQMNLETLRGELKISFNKARWLKQQFKEGQSVPSSWLTARSPHRRPHHQALPSPSLLPKARTEH